MINQAVKALPKKCALALATCLLTTAPVLAAEGFSLSVPGMSDGDLIASAHAAKGGPRECDGDNISPPLAWSNAPEGTKSFAFLVHDQTGAHGMGVTHWVGYGIPGDVSELAEGALNDAESGAFVGGKNRIGTPTWFGPCPDVGDVPHHYVFTLMATDLEPGALEAGLDREGLLGALSGHTLGATGFVARYARH